MPAEPQLQTQSDAAERGLTGALRGCRWMILALHLLALPMTSVLLYVGKLFAERLEGEVSATPPAFSALVLSVPIAAPLVAFVLIAIGLIVVNRLLNDWVAFAIECSVGLLVAAFCIALIVAIVMLWAAALTEIPQI